MSIGKLKIQNFAGLKDVEIEIKKINIFIGPQASGKSIIVKLLFYFKGVFNDTFTHESKAKNKREFDKIIKNRFETYFPAYTWKNNEFCLYYLIDKEFICIKKTIAKKLSVEYSTLYEVSAIQIRKDFKKIENFFKKIENQLIEEFESEIFKNLELPEGFTPKLDVESMFTQNISRDFIRSFLENFIKQEQGLDINFSQIFIPAGRSFFANLQDNIFGFISESTNLDRFLLTLEKTMSDLNVLEKRIILNMSIKTI